MASEGDKHEHLNNSRTIITLGDTARSGRELQWTEVQLMARSLADALRSKDTADLHTELGRSQLPAAIVYLLEASYGKDKIPKHEAIVASFELLRLAANLCMDHDDNRKQFLDVGLQKAVLSIIRLYSSAEVGSLGLDDFKVARTAVGVVLNSCLGFEPARSSFVALGAPTAIVAISTTLYPPAQWASQPGSSSSPEELISIYQTRIGLADWSWRALSAVTEKVENSMGVDTLRYLVSTLSGFTHPKPASSPLVSHAESRKALVTADLESLEECTALLESLTLDSEEVRMKLAESINNPPAQGGSLSLLQQLLNFIEFGNYPEYWNLDDEEEQKRRKKSFDLYKGAVIKALVSVAEERKALKTLWNKERADGGIFVSKIIDWVRGGSSTAANRDDLIIAGGLALGNLARSDENCEALVRPPFNLGPVLADLLRPDADVKVKHAITGLLKNLVQAPGNRRVLGDSGILTRLNASQIWDPSCDMAEIVQVSAIGVAKHLCNGDVDNTLQLMKRGDGDVPSGTDQILALVERSDSIVVKSEGTRAIAYCVKSLFRKDPQLHSQSPVQPQLQSAFTPNLESRRQEAIETLSQPASVQALVNLFVRGQKHAILLNESSFALALISSRQSGALVVKDALMVPVDPLLSSKLEETSSSNTDTSTSPTGLETLKLVINDTDNKFPAELRANACSLAGTLVKNLPQATEEKGRETIIAALRESLTTLTQAESTPEKLRHAAKWASDAFQ